MQLLCNLREVGTFIFLETLQLLTILENWFIWHSLTNTTHASAKICFQL